MPTGRARLGFVRTGSSALARRSASLADTEEMVPFWEELPEGRCARVDCEEASCEERTGALSWLWKGAGGSFC